MTAPESPTARRQWGLTAGLAIAVVVLGVSLTWIDLVTRHFLAMGGACTTGVSAVSDQRCPSGTGLILAAIPLMLMAGIGASVAARTLRAPNLPMTMCAGLFLILSFDMFNYGFRPINAINLIGGVFTGGLAVPFLATLLTGREHPLRRGSPADRPRVPWVVGYLVLAAVGVALGWRLFGWAVS